MKRMLFEPALASWAKLPLTWTQCLHFLALAGALRVRLTQRPPRRIPALGRSTVKVTRAASEADRYPPNRRLRADRRHPHGGAGNARRRH